MYIGNVLICMYKTLKSNYDKNLLTILTQNRNIHSINTRNIDNYFGPLFKKSTSQNSRTFKVIQLWNELPLVVGNAKSFNIFKRLLDSILFSS